MVIKNILGSYTNLTYGRKKSDLVFTGVKFYHLPSSALPPHSALISYLKLFGRDLLTLATGKIQNIFTREIDYISFGFLFISIVLLIVAIIGFNLKIKRVNEQFQEIRKYYADLLDENDLDRIFGGKTLAAGSLRYIKKQMWVYILAWIVIILIMGTVTYVLMVK